MKELIAMISTKNKSTVQIYKEAKQALSKFNKAEKKVKIMKRLRHAAIVITLLILSVILLLVLLKSTHQPASKKILKPDSKNIQQKTPVGISGELNLTTAEEYLIKTISESKINEYWANNPCVFYWPAERTEYFQIQIHEKHEGNCPGVPGVSPMAAMFRIDKKTKEISHYDVKSDRFVPFQEYVNGLPH